MTLAWIEQRTCWSGVNCATLIPQSQKEVRKKYRTTGINISKRLTEHSADTHHTLKDGAGEACSESQGDAARETQIQGFVLRHEKQLGVSVDFIFLQSPGCPEQPALLLLPPQCVVRPIALDLCRHKTQNLLMLQTGLMDISRGCTPWISSGKP